MKATPPLPSLPRPSVPLLSYVTSTIGRKTLVAITGLMLFGFVIMHLAGNLLIYQGPAALNEYAAFLKSKPAVVWAGRIGLLGALSVHLWGTLSLAARNRSARPVGYRMRRTIVSTLSSRTMVLTGFTILAFVVYHLLHFTVGVTHPDHHALVEATATGTRHDVFAMVVAGFREPVVASIYIVAQVMLAVHLSHGVASTVQTLGFNHPTFTPLVKRGGITVAVLLALGNGSIPIAVLAGWIGGNA